MKRLFTLLIFLVSLGLNAQHVDLIVSDIHLSSDTNNLVPVGLTTSAAVTIQNTDSSIVEAGDTIYMYMEIDGNVFVGMEVLSSPLNPGGEIYHNFGDTSLFTCADTVGPFMVYAEVNYGGDTIDSNDVGMEEFNTAVFVDNSWNAVTFEVINPFNLDGFDIDNGSNIPPNVSEASIVFQNDGMVTYLQHTPFHYVIYMDGDTSSIEVDLSADDIAPGDSTVRNLTNMALFPDIPDSVGTYMLCAAPIEPISNNGSFCYAFEIVDNYNPNDPINWPHGIQSIERSAYDMINTTTGVGLVNLEGPIDVKIFSLNGSLIHNLKLSSDGFIDLSSSSAGIYLLEVRSNNQLVGQEKIVRL